MSKTTNFKKDVLHEINMLKQHATQKELNRLNWGTFCHSRGTQCIYGQMTGDWKSPRAKKLMNAACIKTVNTVFMHNGVDGMDINSKEFIVGDKDMNRLWVDDDFRTFHYLSALEGYIFTKDSKNKEILQYMKGEIDSIKL